VLLLRWVWSLVGEFDDALVSEWDDDLAALAVPG
jgi:hypothetical protein